MSESNEDLLKTLAEGLRDTFEHYDGLKMTQDDADDLVELMAASTIFFSDFSGLQAALGQDYDISLFQEEEKFGITIFAMSEKGEDFVKRWTDFLSVNGLE